MSVVKAKEVAESESDLELSNRNRRVQGFLRQGEKNESFREKAPSILSSPKQSPHQADMSMIPSLNISEPLLNDEDDFSTVDWAHEAEAYDEFKKRAKENIFSRQGKCKHLRAWANASQGWVLCLIMGVFPL